VLRILLELEVVAPCAKFQLERAFVKLPASVALAVAQFLQIVPLAITFLIVPPVPKVQVVSGVLLTQSADQPLLNSVREQLNQ